MADRNSERYPREEKGDEKEIEPVWKEPGGSTETVLTEPSPSSSWLNGARL